jgi:hypothetical protein
MPIMGAYLKKKRFLYWRELIVRNITSKIRGISSMAVRFVDENTRKKTLRVRPHDSSITRAERKELPGAYPYFKGKTWVTISWPLLPRILKKNLSR